jgi:hypothetical protein
MECQRAKPTGKKQQKKRRAWDGGGGGQEGDSIKRGVDVRATCKAERFVAGSMRLFAAHFGSRVLQERLSVPKGGEGEGMGGMTGEG